MYYLNKHFFPGLILLIDFFFRKALYVAVPTYIYREKKNTKNATMFGTSTILVHKNRLDVVYLSL